MVSIIVPNYNHAAYLKRRLASVLGQTYEDFEVILLDDCSTDNSKKIIEQYKDHPKVTHIVYNEQNSGSTFKQWNKGIELASGEYIWLAESDDWCELTLLETLVDAFQKNGDLVLAYASSMAVRDDKVEKVVFSSQELDSVAFTETWRRETLLDRAGVFNASSALFRRSALTDVDLDAFQRFKLCGDLYFWFHLAGKGSVYTTCRVLNYSRRHEANVTEAKSRDGVGFIEYIGFLQEAQKSPAYDEQVAAYLKRKITDHYVYMHHHGVFNSPEAEKGVFNEICRFLPGFRSHYRVMSLRYQLHHLKKQGLRLLNK